MAKKPDRLSRIRKEMAKDARILKVIQDAAKEAKKNKTAVKGEL